MGTRFTRVTVIGDGRQIDISLPADSPLTEQMPAVLRLLSVPSTPVPVRWRLAAPALGALDPNRSLDDVGVLDGAALYLTEAAAAPPPPFVDDVETAVAETVIDSAPTWQADARRRGVARVLAIVLVGALFAGLAAPSAVGWIAPVLVLLSGLGVGAVFRERGGLLAALTAGPAGPAFALGLIAARPSILGAPDVRAPNLPSAAAPPVRPIDALAAAVAWNGFPLLLLLAATLGLAAAGAVRRNPGLLMGALVAAVVTFGALISTRAGLPVDRTAGLALGVAVIVAGLAGQTALGGAGLVDLMVADERGEPVPRALVISTVRRGLSLAGGMVWAAVVVAGSACWVLVIRAPDDGAVAWIAPALGVLGGVIFGLRARMFTRAAHVGPMLAVPTTAATAAALRLPAWFGLAPEAGSVLSLLALIVVGALVLVGGLRTLREVSGARLQRGFERLELLAVLALVPGFVLLFRVIPAVQRWWS